MRQFGSDISMIQQLFPGRTRTQIKLKYKKEERQHHLRLHEARTTRAKGKVLSSLCYDIYYTGWFV